MSSREVDRTIKVIGEAAKAAALNHNVVKVASLPLPYISKVLITEMLSASGELFVQEV